MFDTVRNNRRIVQIFLALITLPFALWGVDAYINNAASVTEVARVGDVKVGASEFQLALQKQQDRLRNSLGAGATPEMLDTPDIRKNVLEGLINQHLLGLHAARTGIGVTDEQLLQVISAVPSLQENGRFSKQRYEALVAAQGLSKETFEARLRQDISIQQMIGSVADASITGQSAGSRWVSAMLEEREVSVARIAPETFAAQVMLGKDAAQKYYEAHKSSFAVPEQVKPEFAVLNQAELAGQIKIGNDEIKAWYSTHADQYRQAEQRRASHILIGLAKEANPDQVKLAQEKAARLLESLRKNPSEFAALARQNSQDPGSAANGGDLDWFGRGSMVKPFEDAAFSLNEGEVSGIVRSDFGLHIIKITGVRPERVKPLEEVASQIEQELKTQAAAKKYAEIAEGFSNTVYEQADSLQPVADRFNLKIQEGNWLVKGSPGGGAFDNPKLVAALFSEDVVKNRRNTEAVEVAPGTLVAARVSEYRPATLRTFDTVRPEIETKLARMEEARLARIDGEAKLDQLRSGKSPALSWSVARNVPRLGIGGLPSSDVQVIFRADVSRLPAYVGKMSEDAGYIIFRITRMVPFSSTSDPRADILGQQYARVVAGEELHAWLASLRKFYPVVINDKAVSNKEH